MSDLVFENCIYCDNAPATEDGIFCLKCRLQVNRELESILRDL